MCSMHDSVNQKSDNGSVVSEWWCSKLDSVWLNEQLKHVLGLAHLCSGVYKQHVEEACFVHIQGLVHFL